MVQVTLTYVIKATNTGVAHDLICGCSLLDSSGETELYRLPWWVIWNVPTGNAWTVTISASGDIPAGTYTAICRAWTGYTIGTKAFDLKLPDGTVVGICYQASDEDLMIPPALDEATQTLTIGVAGVSARIDDFNITI